MYSMKKTGGKRKMFITIEQMRQVDWAAAEHLLSPFWIPFFGVKLLNDYGFRVEMLHGVTDLDLRDAHCLVLHHKFLNLSPQRLGLSPRCLHIYAGNQTSCVPCLKFCEFCGHKPIYSISVSGAFLGTSLPPTPIGIGLIYIYSIYVYNVCF